MEKVQQTVEIKLTKEECEILWKAEQLLCEMKKEICDIATPLYKNDKEEITECLDSFHVIAARYNVHCTLGTEDDIDQILSGDL